MVRYQVEGRTAAEIADSIERLLRGGRLEPAEPLPSIRALAERLSVSPVTVAGAYRVLRARGLTSGDGRRGTRVRTGQSGMAPAPMMAARSAGTLVDLASGNPDPELLLPPTHADMPAHHLYGSPAQSTALEAFAAGELQADGIPARALAIVSGGMDAIDRILRDRLQPGDRVAVEDPGFPPLFDLLAASGMSCEPMAIDPAGPTPGSLADALRRRARAVIITRRAHNPTGASLTPERAAALKRALRAHRDVMLIEIDPAGPLAIEPASTLCDGTHPAWASVRPTSKFLGPDLRVAIVSGDDLTIGRMRSRFALGPRWVSHVLQHLALARWSDPSSGRALARAAEIYAQRRTALLDALRVEGIPGMGRSGYHVWVPVPEEARVVQSLAERGWAVASGERFRIRSAPAIRVTVSALLPAEARRFAVDLAQALRPPEALA